MEGKIMDIPKRQDNVDQVDYNALIDIVGSGNERPDWDNYYLLLCRIVALRADCRRRRVGAVIVGKDHRPIMFGYNGAASGHPGCLSGNCPRGLLSYDEVKEFSNYDEGPGRCISIHAEINALLNAKADVAGATVYVTDQPCPTCRKLLVGAGLAKAVWGDPDNYHVDDLTVIPLPLQEQTLEV